MQFDVLASGYGLVEGPTIDARRRRVLQRRARRRRVPRRNRRARSTPSSRSGAASAASRCTPTAASSAPGATSCTCTTARRRRCSRSTGSSAGTTSAPTRAGRVYAGALRFAVFDRDATAVPGECWRIDGRGRRDAAVRRRRPRQRHRALARRAHAVPLRHTRERGHRAHAARRRHRDRPPHHRHVARTASPTAWPIDERRLRSGSRSLEYGIGRFTPDGMLDRRIEVPSTLTTSVCFDGHDLYVTTADHTGDPELRGCLLRTAGRRRRRPRPPARVDPHVAPVRPRRSTVSGRRAAAR